MIEVVYRLPHSNTMRYLDGNYHETRGTFGQRIAASFGGPADDAARFCRSAASYLS
jgi:hypothetical protein